MDDKEIMMSINKDVIILIAEDDDGHADLIMENLRDAGVKNEIIRFCDGEEILNYLFTDKNIQNKSYLILLDIRMPKVDGIETLTRIKKEDRLKNIPIIMLTTTDDPREIEKCYAHGCNNYITKPVDFKSFSETLNRLGLFILIVQVPEINK